ncbi:hypothetical protein [Burkholderia cepacia]|uniref:hypothetical protein n=1 Tax=Burkholderia cepacia TaxID=292 RepID=UPI0021582AF0|nr:hypothetical protein [Burkholderia cepacia]
MFQRLSRPWVVDPAVTQQGVNAQFIVELRLWPDRRQQVAELRAYFGERDQRFRLNVISGSD